MSRIAAFVGEIARPFAIISTSASVSIATVIIANKVHDGNDGFLVVGGMFTGAAAFYIGKAVEEFRKARAVADVQIAAATGSGPPAEG